MIYEWLVTVFFIIYLLSTALSAYLFIFLYPFFLWEIVQQEGPVRSNQRYISKSPICILFLLEYYLHIIFNEHILFFVESTTNFLNFERVSSTKLNFNVVAFTSKFPETTMCYCCFNNFVDLTT